MLGLVEAGRRRRQHVGFGDVTGFMVDVNLIKKRQKQISRSCFLNIIITFQDSDLNPSVTRRRLTSRGASLPMNSS